jgi:hypothetical protein
MKKSQMVWMWIFIVMFVIPEILFFNIAYFFNPNMPSLFSLIFESTSEHNIIYLLIFFVVEIIGIFGLFIMSLKFERTMLSIILGILAFWLCLTFYFVCGPLILITL